MSTPCRGIRGCGGPVCVFVGERGVWIGRGVCMLDKCVRSVVQHCSHNQHEMLLTYLKLKQNPSASTRPSDAKESSSRRRGARVQGEGPGVGFRVCRTCCMSHEKHREYEQDKVGRRGEKRSLPPSLTHSLSHSPVV